jgi:hypothetical protein
MPDRSPTLAALQAWLAQVYGGRRTLLAFDVSASTTSLARELSALGAGPLAVLAAREGIGTGPELPTRVVGAVGGDMMETLRAGEAALSSLQGADLDWLDAWDPDRGARVIRTLFSDGAPVGGRPSFGARPAAWQALEDKTTIDALWDAVGVPRAPSAVVPATGPALRAAHAALDQGAGTVWAADNKRGWHGGANGLRWARPGADLDALVAFFEERADSVRVMPFIEGVPCSVHGIVAPTAEGRVEVIALRPCEMLVLRRPGEARFVYCSVGTFWDPPAADRAGLRALAKAVGAALHARLGYRGTFTIDGVMGAEGFRPTELNPRFGGAIAAMGSGLGLPLYLLHLALVEGVPLPVPAADLEAELLAAADQTRVGGALAELPTPQQTRTLRLVAEEEGWRAATTEEAPAVTVHIGPWPSGGMLRANFAPTGAPVGPPLAHSLVRLLRWLDAAEQLGIGALEAAQERRFPPPA